MKKFSRLIIIFLVFYVWTDFFPAQAAANQVQIDIKTFKLANGMLFLVVERPTTPQVACRLAIRAGSALEETGKTGIAHLLEHMMFKGTRNFGTLDNRKDAELQRQIESAYQTILQEKQKRMPDTALIQQKGEEMLRLRREVQQIFVPQSFSAQLGKNGAVGVNAFTSKDQTQYILSVPSDMLEQWFSIASEQIFEPAWREFYVEKEVVQREWAFRYINSASGAAWLDLDATAYHAHPYRNPVIGWKSDMAKYSTEDAIAFHQAYYNPSNAVVVLVGDVTLEKARRLAEIYFGRYPAGRRAPETVTVEPQQQGPRESIRYLKGARTPMVRIGFHTVRMQTEDFYALDAMTMILSQGHGARMTQNIVNKGLAVQAWAYNPDNRYGGMVVLGGSPNEPEGLDRLPADEKRQSYLAAGKRLKELLLTEIEKIKNEPVTERELARIKKLNQRDFLNRLRSNESLAGTLATLEVQTGWQYLSTYLDRMDRVTPQDILRVAKKYFNPDNQTTIYILPGGKPDLPPDDYVENRSLSGSAAAGVKAPEKFENHSAYPTPAGWKHPLSFERKPVKIEYPVAHTFTVEGATVYYLPDRELPLIDLSILIKAGAVDIDRNLKGLAQILGKSIVRGGTEQYAPVELALVLDENAIEISVSVSQEDTRVRMSVMKEDWQKGLALLRQVLTKPRFDPQVVKVAKEQTLVALKRQGENARAVARREAMIWHFKDHPYGRDPLDAINTIPKITRDDLKRFLSDFFVPSNMVVAVAGDISKPEVKSGLEFLFADISRKDAPGRNTTPPPLSSAALILVHKPGQVQSQISLTLRSVKRNHPDYWKISLLTDIFGGSDSLLYKRLRSDLGLVYAAGFYQAFKWEAGYLSGYIGCKGSQTREALVETLKIMASLQKEIPVEIFKQKKLDTLNSFVFNVDSPFALAEAYGRYHLRNEPLNTLDKIQETFLQTSREELRQLAQKYLDPDKIQIVVVADLQTRVKDTDNRTVSLSVDLEAAAKDLGLTVRHIDLR